MDQKDEKILEYLQDHGRAPFTEISEKIGVSEGTVRNRVQKLQEKGVIEKFTVEINRKQDIKAFVTADISTDREFDEVINEFSEDVEVFELAGDTDLLVKVSGENSGQINEVVDNIRGVEGVKDTKTYMVLSERK
ncbi:MAG: Lrp/AsnC family transcriptional regulator [Candidatus Nanosalina sp.]